MTFVYGLLTGGALVAAGAYFYGVAVVESFKHLTLLAYADINKLKADIAGLVEKIKAAI